MEENRKFWKSLDRERCTVDRLVCGVPCFLFYAALVADAVGAATAVLRDGQDTNAGILIDLAALTSSYDRRRFDPPVYFKKGLYVDVGLNVTSVLVQFMIE